MKEGPSVSMREEGHVRSLHHHRQRQKALNPRTLEGMGEREKGGRIGSHASIPNVSVMWHEKVCGLPPSFPFSFEGAKGESGQSKRAHESPSHEAPFPFPIGHI